MCCVMICVCTENHTEETSFAPYQHLHTRHTRDEEDDHSRNSTRHKVAVQALPEHGMAELPRGALELERLMCVCVCVC